MEPLTEKQRKVLAFIESHLAGGTPPSQREIARQFRLSQNAIHQLIGYLRHKGYLDETPGHRNLRLSRSYLRHSEQTKGLPIVGAVAAGQPVLAEENIEGRLDPASLVPDVDGAFLLRVRGDSMVDEGILDGDLVAVDPNSAVHDGQIAVVLIDDEAAIKRIYTRDNQIVLKSANRAKRYKTRYINVSEKDIRIVGKVVACLRTNIK